MSDKNEQKSTMQLVAELLKNQEDLRLIIDKLADESGLAKKTLDLHSNSLIELMSRLSEVEETTVSLRNEMTGIKAHFADIPVNNNLINRVDLLKNTNISRIVSKIQADNEITVAELIELKEYADSRKDADLYVLISQAQSRQDHPKEALQFLDKAISLGKSGLHLKCRRGQLFLDLEMYKEALYEFEEVKKIPRYQSDPICKANVLRFIAYSLLNLRSFDKSMEAIEQSLRLNDKNPTAWWVKERILMETGREIEALGPIEKALEVDQFFIPSLNDKAKILAIHSIESAKEALKVLDIALSVDKKDTVILRNKALVYQRIGLPKEAIEILDNVISLDKNNSNSYCSRALSKCELGDVEGAIADMEMARKLGLNCERSHSCLASILLKQKKYQDALEEVDVAIKDDPDDLVLIMDKAVILFEMDKKDEISAIINKIKSEQENIIKSSKASTLNAISYKLYQLGIEYAHIGLPFIEKAVELEPTDPRSLDTLACLLSVTNENERSLDTFLRAIENKITNADISWLELANVYDKLGKHEEANNLRKQ